MDHEFRRSRLKKGDLLLSIRGHVGRLAIVPAELDSANITQDTARLSPLPRLETEYLMGCLASSGMQELMARQTKGGTVQGINLGDVKELPIPVPPLEVQQRYTAVAARFKNLRKLQREALRQADHLFQLLLHRAFTTSI
jgi:type I restriction enzyme S subunit